MNLPVGIGVDVGTSGVRAAALTGRGPARDPVLARASAPLPTSRRPRDGASEQDPEDWWRALVAVLRQLSDGLASRGALADGPRALCLDGTSASLLLAGADGRPLTPALMYDDRRATEAAARVATVAPADSPALGPGSSLAKALHLLSDPAQHHADGHVLHQADWLAGRLLGRFGDSDWNNALKLGFDVHARRWPDWLHALDLPTSALPRVHAPGTRLGRIEPSVARACGLPTQTWVCAGTTDSTAAVIAAGAADIGDAVTSLGSTLVLKILSAEPVQSARHGVYSHRFGDAWLVGGASNSGGAVLQRFFDDAALRRLSAQIDPSRDSGLDYYPLPAVGERFPIHDPALAPKIDPRPADDARFLHGLLEGIARIERDGYRLLASLGAPAPRRVLSTGGGAANPTWTALRRRLLGVEVVPADAADAAEGAAELALRAAIG